jgi:hypothetical protein
VGVWRAGPTGKLDGCDPELLIVDGELCGTHHRERQPTIQIPPFYQLLDRCDQVLDPQRGLMGVVDFYTSRDLGNKERVSLALHELLMEELPT